MMKLGATLALVSVCRRLIRMVLHDVLLFSMHVTGWGRELMTSKWVTVYRSVSCCVAY